MLRRSSWTASAKRWLDVVRVSLLVSALGCAGMACASLMAGLEPKPGADRDRIRVPHDLHVEELGGCDECHGGVTTSGALGGHTLLPKEEVCLECHADAKEEGNCAMCHTNPEKPQTYPEVTWTLHFSHANHMERVGGACDVCHAALPNPVRTGEGRPAMATCLTCHEHQADYDGGRCEVCHEDLSRYPLRPIADFRHQGDFLRSHGASARARPEACADCHQQDFCSECHARTAAMPIDDLYPERTDRSFIHRGDFIARHPIEARFNAATCSRCHATRFCATCHREQSLTTKADDPRNPHPAGWVFPGGGHGVEARRDITRCAACHADGPASICIDCHRVGGIGGNPHPPGWTSQHDEAEANRNGMCLHCHR